MPGPAFCEHEDVREALQKIELKGAIDTDMVEPAILAASRWFARQTNGHWYDANAKSGDLVDSTVASATDVVCDVPSSPHAQERQLISSRRGAEYPVTVAGRYAEVVLPHLYVSSLTKLEVRDRDGGVTDWVADGDFSSGRGNEYYLQSRGQNSYGRTYLYVEAAAIGARTNFDRLLTLAYDYGLDFQTTPWDDVKRGIAQLAAAELVSEDSVIAQIPESGTLIGVETQHQQLTTAADSYLGDYISAAGDNR